VFEHMLNIFFNLRLLTYPGETLLLECFTSIVIKLMDYLDAGHVTQNYTILVDF